MAGQLVGLGDGGGGQAQGGHAGAGAGAGSQVADDGEGIGRQGREAYLVAPSFKEPPLGAVDPAGVVGEDGLQGGATPWSAARRANLPAGGRGTICGSLAAVVMDDSGGVTKSLS